MYPDSSPDYDDSSSSSRSTSSSCSASPTGDVARCSQRSPDSPTNASSMDSSMSQDVCGEIDSPWQSPFVPTVTAISTSMDLHWMVQPTTDITSASVSPFSCSSPSPSSSSSSPSSPSPPSSSSSSPSSSSSSSPPSSSSSSPPSSSSSSSSPPSSSSSSSPPSSSSSSSSSSFSSSPSSGRAKLSRAHGATQSSSRVEGSKEQSTCKKGKKQPLSEEDERRKIRRERNKVAAAKCRNRRRELTDTLQAETDQLEGDKEALQTEIGHLLKEKERLEQILSTHQPACKLATAEDDVEHEINDDIEGMLQDTADSAQLLSILENSDKLQLPEGSATEVTVSKGPLRHEMDSVPVPSISISASAILGNSNILLCSSAEEEPMEDLDFDQRDLQDLVPSLELAVAPETAPSVPDIDLLGGPFCLSDWETLYKSVANDLEPLCNPTMMSSSDTPTCSSYRSVFSFNYSEVDHMAEDEGCCESSEGLKGVVGGSSDLINGNLNSPTLLAL